jgi:hypothetical protein
MKKPCGDVPVVSKGQLQEYPHLKTVNIFEAPSEVIDVLLGVETGDVLTPDEKILGPGEGDPIVARCLLGWYVQGGCGSENVLTNAVTNFTLVSATRELEYFLGIEKLGIEPKRCKCAIDEEKRAATETMQQSLTMLESGAYQINLPWKKTPAELPNNYEYTTKCLVNLENHISGKFTVNRWTISYNEELPAVYHRLSWKGSSARENRCSSYHIS